MGTFGVNISVLNGPKPSRFRLLGRAVKDGLSRKSISSTVSDDSWPTRHSLYASRMRMALGKRRLPGVMSVQDAPTGAATHADELAQVGADDVVRAVGAPFSMALRMGVTRVAGLEYPIWMGPITSRVIASSSMTSMVSLWWSSTATAIYWHRRLARRQVWSRDCVKVGPVARAIPGQTTRPTTHKKPNENFYDDVAEFGAGGNGGISRGRRRGGCRPCRRHSCHGPSCCQDRAGPRCCIPSILRRYR